MILFFETDHHRVVKAKWRSCKAVRFMMGSSETPTVYAVMGSDTTQILRAAKEMGVDCPPFPQYRYGDAKMFSWSPEKLENEAKKLFEMD